MTIDTNELRRLAQEATPGQWMIDYVGVGFEVAAGESVIAQSQQIQGDIRHKTRKANAAFIAAANPAAISDLLDRLEAAEKERDNANAAVACVALQAIELEAKLEAAEKAATEAYQRGYATGQEEIAAERDALRGDRTTLQQMVYSLKDRVEVVEKEYQHVLEVKEIYQRQLNETEDERDALRARIEQMEKQEQVAFGLYSGWALKATYLKEHEACEQRDRRQLTADLAGSLEAYRVVPLYALPGAQPTPSVPKKIKRVESGFKGMFLREAQAYKRGWNECRGAMLSAAPNERSESPEVKP